MSDIQNELIKGKLAENLKKIARAVASRVPRKTRPIAEPSRETGYTLEELIAIGRPRRKSEGEEERLKKEEVVQKRAEILYRLDPLVFAGVNRLRRLISTPRIYWTNGEENDRKIMEEWARKVRFRHVLQEAVQDIIIYGYAIIEKITNDQGEVIRLVTVDPKTVDWQKEDDKLKVDEYGDPVGFVQKPEVSGEEIDLDRDNIILLRFFTLGRECLGISPLEPAFKCSWIRLNLEQAYGEAIYRHGYPLYYFKVGDKDHPTNPALIAEAKKLLKNFDTAQELILPDWVEPGRLDPKSDVRAIVELWAFLAGELARSLDSPLGLVVPGGAQGREGKGGVEFSNIDLEKAIKDYQETLKDQLEDQLFEEVRVTKKIKSLPELRFSESSPQTQLLRMRMISMLSARGALHIDPKSENKIRQELDLPLLEENPTDKDESCIFGFTEICPVKKNKNIPSTQIAQFCKVCPYKEKEKKEKIEGEQDKKKIKGKVQLT